MHSEGELLRVENLRKCYPGANRDVLNGIDMVLNKGDFLCILGPSGCGKSTLIRCIAGFEKYQGQIISKGKKVEGAGPDRMMVFQDFGQLFPWMTVYNNLKYPLRVNGLKNKAEIDDIALKYLKIVKLDKYKDYYPHQLSGGMKQRVAIARGFVLNPDLILMDEPFAALDAISRNEMQTELERIKNETNMTVIFITHNIQEAVSLGNRIIVMSRDGKIKEEIVNTLEKPVTPATAGYGAMWEHLHEMIS